MKRKTDERLNRYFKREDNQSFGEYILKGGAQQ